MCEPSSGSLKHRFGLGAALGPSLEAGAPGGGRGMGNHSTAGAGIPGLKPRSRRKDVGCRWLLAGNAGDRGDARCPDCGPYRGIPLAALQHVQRCRTGDGAVHHALIARGSHRPVDAQLAAVNDQWRSLPLHCCRAFESGAAWAADRVVGALSPGLNRLYRWRLRAFPQRCTLAALAASRHKTGTAGATYSAC